MSGEKSPDWLPDGWIMEVKRTKSGTKHRYYTSPVSQCTFRTKKEVLHYLNVDKVEHRHGTTSCCQEDNMQGFAAQGNDSPEWLPNGWILEIKTRTNGAKYKCYFDPFTGSRFYSKREVFQYLKEGRLSTPNSDRKQLLSTSSMDNVLAQIQYSPDGLPHGWIKETKFRKSNRHSEGIRKDQYYTDQGSGYVFRSLKDSIHYIQTGEVSKNTITSPKMRIDEKYSLKKESPPPISAKKLKSHGATVLRQHLFAGGIDEFHKLANGRASSQYNCVQGKGEAKQRRKSVVEPATEELPKPDTDLKQKAKKRKMSEPTPENFEGPTDHFEHYKSNPKDRRSKTTRSSITQISEPIRENSCNAISPDISESKPMESEKKSLDYSEPSEKLLEPPNENQLQLKISVEKRGRKSGSKKSNLTPCRSSKRLSGLEADPVSDFKIGNHTRGSTTKKLFDEKIEKYPDSSEPSEKQLPGKISVEKRGRKPGSKKSSSPPCRSSKRLAGLEAVPVSDIKISNPNRSTDTKPSDGAKDSSDQTENEGTKPSEKQLQGKISVEKRGRKPGSKKSSSPPCRSSKRLAGLEAVPVSDIKISNPNRSTDSKPSDGAKDSSDQTENEGKKPSDGSKDSSDQTANEGGEPTLGLSFGDSWLDSCIDFAFKTLTSDITVLEDPFAGKWFFDQKLTPSPSSSPAVACKASIEVPDQLEKGHKSQ